MDKPCGWQVFDCGYNGKRYCISDAFWKEGVIDKLTGEELATLIDIVSQMSTPACVTYKGSRHASGPITIMVVVGGGGDRFSSETTLKHLCSLEEHSLIMLEERYEPCVLEDGSKMYTSFYCINTQFFVPLEDLEGVYK